jgi:hypothetical protein
MNNLRRLFFHLFVWFASLSIVVTSIVFVLPNAELHKKRLNDNNFYEKINAQIKPETGSDKVILQNSFSYILSNSIIKEIVTPTWLRGVIEKNIDITSSWLSGKDNWELYVPTKDVEQAIQKSINRETESFVTANKKEIKVCTQSQSDTIKSEGFDLNKEFCIPSEVRNNQKTLTEFVSNSNTLSLSSAGILNNLVKDSNLSTTSEIQNIDEIAAKSSKVKQNILSTINSFRDASLTLRNNILGLFLIIAGLMLANALFLQATRRNPMYFIFRACFAITFYTFVFCGIFVFAVGGTSYVTSLFKEFLLPGFVNTEILKLASGQLVTFALDLVYPAIVSAILIFLIGLFVWTLNRFNVFAPTKFKNNNPKSPSYGYKKLFQVSEESILPNNTHNEKLELLKTYKPDIKDEQQRSLPSSKVNIPLEFKSENIETVTSLNTVANSTSKPYEDQPDITVNDFDSANSRVVKKIQL